MSTSNRQIFYVELVIIFLTGIGGTLALISVCLRSSWISVKLFKKLHRYSHFDNLTKCETSCLLTIIGVICSATSALIGIIRQRKISLKRAKTCRTVQFVYLIAGFISLLSSVAVWADFLRHLPNESVYPLKRKFTKYLSDKQRQQLKDDKPVVVTDSSDVNIKQFHSPVKWIKFVETIHRDSHSHQSASDLFGWAYWICVVSAVFLFLANLIYLMRKDCERQQATEAV
uniref:Uncharacterized protein n=1 Tax=Trichobilharzia regenti TaxID=157069 RepID=A0AA85JT08_TRIRE|nr:unnamed protein product [Trichobilharzia regenti]